MRASVVAIILLAVSVGSAQDKPRRTKPRSPARIPAQEALPTAKDPIAPAAKNPIDPAAMKFDPDAIPHTSPRTFDITHGQLGTRSYSNSIAICQLARGGFAMVYEAVVDESQGGSVQTLLVYLTQALGQHGNVLLISPRHSTSVVYASELVEFADESLLLTWLERSESPSDHYSVKIMTFGRDGRIARQPQEISKPMRNQRLLGVTLMPGGMAALATVQHDDTTFVSVVASTGRRLLRKRALRNCPVPSAPGKIDPTPEIHAAPRLTEDGLLFVAAHSHGESGLIFLDGYGQWVGDFRPFKKKQGKKLEEKIQNFMPLPGSERFLLRLSGQPGTLVAFNEPRRGHAVHQFGTEIPMAGDRFRIFPWDEEHLLICYAEGAGPGKYSIHAATIRNLGTITKPDQVVLADALGPVKLLQMQNGDILLVSPTLTAKRFQYSLIRNP